MREALVILLVLAVLLALTAVRYRKQIAAMFRIWQSLKTMKQQMNKQMGQSRAEDREVNTATGPLVNCAKCGTWVPEQRAIKLRGGMTYCSAACLETTTSAR